MSNKYIIKNCPAIFKHPVGHWNCQQGKECQDCTDCVLKQIVELCKSACIDCSNIKRVTYTQCKDLNNCKTAKILKLLDTQEVE